jgi:hypothetical protein
LIEIRHQLVVLLTGTLTEEPSLIADGKMWLKVWIVIKSGVALKNAIYSSPKISATWDIDREYNQFEGFFHESKINLISTYAMQVEIKVFR